MAWIVVDGLKTYTKYMSCVLKSYTGNTTPNLKTQVDNEITVMHLIRKPSFSILGNIHPTEARLSDVKV